MRKFRNKLGKIDPVYFEMNSPFPPPIILQGIEYPILEVVLSKDPDRIVCCEYNEKPDQEILGLGR